MLSEEEKKALERIEDFLTTNIILSLSSDETANAEELTAFISKNEYLSIEFIASMFLKQSKEIEHQKEKRENQRNELAILNAKQIEFNKLVNTVNSYKGQFKRQQKEIEELKKYKEGYKLLSYSLDNYTSNDKIKAKIEYYEKIDNPVGKRVLESLLEKE